MMGLRSHSTSIVRGGRNADCIEPEVRVEVRGGEESEYVDMHGR